MPLLVPGDDLPPHPRRVVVGGTSGSGKSTLARRLAALWDLPYTELDSLFHGPGWTPNADFRERVADLVAQPAWVCEFQYDQARPALAARAQLVVWLDLGVPVTMWRVTRRTVLRRLRGQELWNGNREGPLREVFTDREHIVRWAWSTRNDAAERIESLLNSRPHLPVLRLTSPRQVERWLAHERVRLRSAR